MSQLTAVLNIETEDIVLSHPPTELSAGQNTLQHSYSLLQCTNEGNEDTMCFNLIQHSDEGTKVSIGSPSPSSLREDCRQPRSQTLHYSNQVIKTPLVISLL